MCCEFNQIESPAIESVVEGRVTELKVPNMLSLTALSLISMAVVTQTILSEIRFFRTRLIEGREDIPALIKYNDENERHLEARDILRDNTYQIKGFSGKEFPNFLKSLKVGWKTRAILAETGEETVGGTRIYEIDEEGIIGHKRYDERTKKSSRHKAVYSFITFWTEMGSKTQNPY